MSGFLPSHTLGPGAEPGLVQPYNPSLARKHMTTACTLQALFCFYGFLFIFV